MGCVCVPGKTKITTIVAKQVLEPKIKKKKNFFYSVSKNVITKILDFLKYSELQEAGKVNRLYFINIRKMNKIARSQAILSKFYRNKRKEIINEKCSDQTTKLILKQNSDNVNSNSMHYILGMKNNSETHNDVLWQLKVVNINKKETPPAEPISNEDNENSNMNFPNKEINSNEQNKLERKTNKLSKLKKQKSTNMTGMSLTSKSEDDFQKPKMFVEDYNNSKVELVFQTKSHRDSCSDNRTPSFKERIETENSREKDGISSIGDCLADLVYNQISSLSGERILPDYQESPEKSVEEVFFSQQDKYPNLEKTGGFVVSP